MVMKPFVAYDKETENVRTITVVSNPGAEHEKTESFQAAKGLAMGLAPDFGAEQNFTAYLDAACTQPLEEEPDTNSNITCYIEWEE